jgi:hypothetical protein
VAGGARRQINGGGGGDEGGTPVSFPAIEMVGGTPVVGGEATCNTLKIN